MNTDTDMQRPEDVIYCRASAAGDQLGVSKAWTIDEPVKFMYMPAGVSTITAGFRGKAINITVKPQQVEGAALAPRLGFAAHQCGARRAARFPLRPRHARHELAERHGWPSRPSVSTQVLPGSISAPSRRRRLPLRWWLR